MAFYDLIELSGIWLHGIPLGLDECDFLVVNADLPDMLMGCVTMLMLIDYGESLSVDTSTLVLKHDVFNGEIVVVCP